MGSRWMARAAKFAVVEKRDANPFVRPMRWMACGGMRIGHLVRMTVSSRDNFCDSVSKRSSSVAVCLRVRASSDCAKKETNEKKLREVRTNPP
jgi:hypothetical protein